MDHDLYATGKKADAANHNQREENGGNNDFESGDEYSGEEMNDCPYPELNEEILDNIEPAKLQGNVERLVGHMKKTGELGTRSKVKLNKSTGSALAKNYLDTVMSIS